MMQETSSDGVILLMAIRMVCECKKCFTKYRFHGTLGNRFDFDNFAFYFMMRTKMGKEK